MKKHVTYLNGEIGTALPQMPTRQAKGWPLRFFSAIREFRRIQRDYRKLLEMPDHVLNDIGLQRHQIARERRDHWNRLVWIFGR